MRSWRALGPAGRFLAVACPVLAATVTAVVVRTSDLDGVPDSFEERTPEVSCGTVEVAHELTRGPEIACFVTALADGADAEVVVRASTVEGDPYVTYYRTLTDGRGLEYFVDATQDAFGSGRWEHYRCPGARDLQSLEVCREV